MPWPVYSERVLHHQASGTWRWTVPAGKRFLVREVCFVNLAAADAYVFVRIGPIVMAIAALLAVNSTLAVHTSQVAYQGEVVELFISATGYHTTVSGHLLDDDSGATGPPAGAAQLPAFPEYPEVKPVR
jgi:hypothetical protein